MQNRTFYQVLPKDQLYSHRLTLNSNQSNFPLLSLYKYYDTIYRQIASYTHTHIPVEFEIDLLM